MPEAVSQHPADDLVKFDWKVRPVAVDVVERLCMADELEEIGRVYKKVAGFEMDSVNTKAGKTEGESDRLQLKSPGDWV